MKKAHLIFILFLISFYSYSQENKAIQKLGAEVQKCLDTGNNMLNCTIEYYTKIDEQLNITYNKIRASLSKPEQENLKNKQLAWLKKRDQYFKKVKAETAKELDGENQSQDYRMICSHKNALFVRDRVSELEKTYSKN